MSADNSEIEQKIVEIEFKYDQMEETHKITILLGAVIIIFASLSIIKSENI